MFGLALLELLLVLAVVGGIIALGVSVARDGLAPGPRRPELPAGPGPDPVLARVKALAWDHRDLDTPLADELITYLNAHERDPDTTAVRNEAGEIAWRHREDSPDLSVLVIDALRRPGA